MPNKSNWWKTQNFPPISCDGWFSQSPVLPAKFSQAALVTWKPAITAIWGEILGFLLVWFSLALYKETSMCLEKPLAYHIFPPQKNLSKHTHTKNKLFLVWVCFDGFFGGGGECDNQVVFKDISKFSKKNPWKHIHTHKQNNDFAHHIYIWVFLCKNWKFIYAATEKLPNFYRTPAF